MRPTFFATIPKRAGDEHLNEDAAYWNPYRRIYAVSDGASDSYNSARWSKILARRFVSEPQFGDQWLKSAIESYVSGFNRESMSWSAQAAYDRGSFATLTGVVISPSGAQVSVAGFGDSIAVLADDDQVVCSFPYEHADQFEQNPLLLSTSPERNASILSQTHSDFRRDWRLSERRNPVILLMTDALGAWLLANRYERVRVLLSLATRVEFSGLVERERRANRMRRDDTTLLIVR